MRSKFAPAFFLVLWTGVIFSFADEAATSKATETPAPLPLSRVLNQAETVAQQLQRLDSELTANDTTALANARLDRTGKALRNFYKESQNVLAANPSLDRVHRFQKAWQYAGRVLDTQRDDLTEQQNMAEGTLGELDALARLWNATLQAASANPEAPEDVLGRIRQVIVQIETTRDKFLKWQQKVISLQTRLLDLRALVDNMLAFTAQGRRSALDKLLERNATPLWKFDVTTPAQEKWGEGTRKEWDEQVNRLKVYVGWQRSVFLTHAGLLLVLIAVLYGLRQFVRHQVRLEKISAGDVRIFEHPIAMGFLLALIVGGFLYPVAPILLEAVIGAFILIPTVVILRCLLAPRLYFILNALVLFYLVDQVRLVLASQPILSRILFVTETLAGVLFLIYVLISFRREARRGEFDSVALLVRSGARCALALLSAALVANLLGRDHLASFLRDGTMRCSYAGVIFFAAFQTLKALTTVGMRVPPLTSLGMVRKQGAVILKRLTFLLKWTLIFCWIIFILDSFALWTPLLESVMAALTDKRHLGSVGFKLADLLLVAGTIWAAFLFSRLVRFVLDADIYPRLRLPGGVPYAISTILHYVILLTTFLGAAAALGIDMTKITILVSALGVGIGFGLQNIINNFVSGLILLFERPVKVGDVIQVADASGAVKRIGIRASVILTPSGSEIIVPNGTLLSERVTNWTLSDRRRVISIPVTVSRETSLDRVMETLRLAVNLHPDILKEPAPEILITNIGATISLEVRAWTEKVFEWNLVRSDIALAINAALLKEKIAMA